ncbi:cyclodeaminase/cyclohydrolase family protein [Streptomyces sp.]|uniref:cyclodeaminase/cyclohydrolase family protein n=1 Tax=Streptomyces sp. TaxID=1931 RepID=UPI002F4047AC
MQDETIVTYLDRLAARVPAPGGGAAAALHAAQGAALLAMVARYTTGERYAPHAERIAELTAEADELRAAALGLAAADARAFTAVTDAYRLPRADDEQQAHRSQAIARALAGAARPPVDVIAAAARIVALAEDLLPIGNPNVVTDIAAATEAARAAAATARVNIEINLGGITDDAIRLELTGVLTDVDPLVARAEAVTEAVRERIHQ